MDTSLLGVIIGGLIGLAGSIVPHLWEKRRAYKAARAVVRAYIAGVLKIEEIRQHAALYQKNIDGLRSGGTQSLMKIYGSEDMGDELQSAAITQIGFLESDIARDVVVFGNMLNGLRVDLKAIALGQMDGLPVSEKIRILENDLKLWNDTQALGRDLAHRLN